MDVVVNYTELEIATIKRQLNDLYSKYTCKSAKETLYKVKCCDLCILKELFLYKWTIDDYTSQSTLLTKEEFTCIAQRIKHIAC